MVEKIIKLKIEQLTPYAKNAKKHPQSQIDAIKKSIERFGFNDPIAVWGEKNIIVEGHGRLSAAKQLGIEEVPCIRLDHMSDDERKAYMLAHNKTTMISDFDEGLLCNELEQLDQLFDMSEFGFDELEKSDIEIEETELKPYRNVHYLITIDINNNDKIIDIIEKLKEIEGVEVESTLN